MTSFARKLKRKNLNTSKKKFIKDFKAAMRSFKKQVKCVQCGRYPRQGENIDHWRINKNSENIDLICTECYTTEESLGDTNETKTDT